MKTLAQGAAALASAFCLIGGLWILLRSNDKNDALSTGIGLYFIGKAFFVGPMLLVAEQQLGRGERSAGP
jgi:hypothetical protein